MVKTVPAVIVAASLILLIVAIAAAGWWALYAILGTAGLWFGVNFDSDES